MEQSGLRHLILVDEHGVFAGVLSQHRMLERIGFQVLAASDGQAALELYQARRGEIVLALLDRTMPGMDGEEMFRRLRQIDPQVPVVMTSGYAETGIVPRFTDQPRCGFLQKPYTLEALTERLREVLETGEPES